MPGEKSINWVDVQRGMTTEIGTQGVRNTPEIKSAAFQGRRQHYKTGGAAFFNRS